MPKKISRSEGKRRLTKDRVLQARIPEQLDDELRERAEQLGLSVSTVVRNVLLHTFDLVEGVVTDSTHIAKALTGWGAPSSDLDTESTVVGWQEAILNRNGVCEQCNAVLPIGQRAAIGMPAVSRATLLCLECLSALSSSAAEPAKPPAAKKGKTPPSKRTAAGRKKTAS